jgi:CheY-like chemotaxis protein
MAKILIAEDERDIRELIAFTLQFAGHEVVTTSNGEEALQAVRAHKPQLVLLDVRMPRLSGYEVCKEIKADPQTKAIPVIFLSAKGQEAEIRDGYDAGADQYLLKPFSPDQLIEQVNKLLSHL